MDLTESIAPRSDQINAEDLLTGPRTVTVTEVHKGASAEQPVDIVLSEFGPGRPFKPSKTVRRILVAAWGADANAYTGRRMTIYRNPAVRFGGQDVGGIRISHLSHITKPMTLALTVTRGKRAPYVVQPLPDEPPKATAERVAEPITPTMLVALNAAMTQDLALRERDDKLRWLSTELGREIGSSKEVSKSEAKRLLDKLTTERNARGIEEEPPADWQGEPVEDGR